MYTRHMGIKKRKIKKVSNDSGEAYPSSQRDSTRDMNHDDAGKTFERQQMGVYVIRLQTKGASNE